MIARIWLPDIELKSKQHSRGYSKTGRTFTDPKYAYAKKYLCWATKLALQKQGWSEPVKTNVAVKISYRANRMNVDNLAGFCLDGLEGAAYLKDGQVDILVVHKRRKGPVGLGITIRTLEVK
jgi:Holliday junction resolvase RusA-like endonuclease